ncbi:GDP-mannose 4,6-dehydratase [Ruminococcus flavefaciens]|uniref:GDP-mannose 4,6-dehydratase n=1 Tax=Ruminococcus flavefaciens TaxID=1265 RepID=UPI0026F0CA72|nr:GDP-mannose 4,6-dehydratase [Ruminococcus flavefaciens]MDD7517361.1 GDP-mannose 4,6-dehydratase [Ruminococcus flavefaciens]MDY5690892.1 GDP-mannose 4,6-dehydratase [Ruminococcus flavefaciens]
MKALIIGAAGFVGGYLIRELKAAGWEVHATCLPNENINEECPVHHLDILKKEAIPPLLDDIKPDVVYHLAAQSSVSVSWKRPQLTAEVNVVGSINVLESVRDAEKKDIRLILIGSGEEYGYIREGACPLSESEPLNPGNIYAATKACQDMLGKIYTRAYKMDIVMVRAFNHSGPEQSNIFVISDFCRQIAEIEKGMKEPVISVGNLSAKRDFTDVRDVVRAYRLLGEKGVSGSVYNVGRGKAVEIQFILDTALSYAKLPIEVKQDPKRMRASDIPLIEPDVSHILSDTGWSAEISMEQTIKDTLDYWRKNI